MQRRAALLLSFFVAGSALASRNGSGQYTLPAGNPVVTLTTISSMWANTTLADLATEMTDSLDRSGKGGMLAPLQLVAGSACSPAFYWSTETTSGIYRNAAADFIFSVSCASVQEWQLNTTAINNQLKVFGVTGTTGTVGALITGGNGSTTNGAGVEGVAGTGAGTAAPGVIGLGSGATLAGSDGAGGLFIGASNTEGVKATGGGTGPGILATGGGGGATGGNFLGGGNLEGIISTGGGTGAALRLTPAATPLTLVNGDIWMDSTLNSFSAQVNGNTLNLLVSAAPQNVSFSSNWGTCAGNPTPKLWKDGFGTVYVHGNACASTGATSSVFTLPSGFRPATDTFPQAETTNHTGLTVTGLTITASTGVVTTAFTPNNLDNVGITLSFSTQL